MILSSPEKFSVYLAIASILVSIYTVYYVSKFHRFELRNLYRSELLNWYESTISILLELKFLNSQKEVNKKEISSLLIKLSANIEMGRFFFPNIQGVKIKNMDANIPIAYRGKRHLILDCLVVMYDIHNSNQYKQQADKIDLLKRVFTSELFYLLDPHKYLVLSKKHKLSKGLNNQTIQTILGVTAEDFSQSIKNDIKNEE